MSVSTPGLLMIFGISASCAANPGCAVFECKGRFPMHQARLDDGRTIHLAEYIQYNAVLRGPQHNFVELSLSVVSDADSSKAAVCAGGVCRRGGVGANVVARRGSEDWHGLERFKFGKLVARSNTSRNEVWVVDVDASRVIATLDCRTGATTGPDDKPPPWATLGGGVRLEAIKSD
ncbi:MAG: hypothetical protein ACE5I3_16030 [Phycisphaerae bacterium]